MPFDRLTTVRDMHVVHLRGKAKTATDVYTVVELNLSPALVADVNTTVSDWTVVELRDAVARHECEHIQKTARDKLKNEGGRWLRDYCAGKLPFELGGKLLVPDAFVGVPAGYLSLHLIGPHVFDQYLSQLEKQQEDCTALLKIVRPLTKIVRDFLKPGATFDQVAGDVYSRIKFGPHS